MAESSHGPDCPCPRCTGFTEGNDLAVRHGAYSSLALQPRAEEHAAALREDMGDLYDPRFEGVISTTAGAGVQYERALAALETATSSDLRWLREDARAWARLYLHGLAELGLTPTSAARLGLTLVQTGDELQRYLAAKYGDRGANGAKGETS